METANKAAESAKETFNSIGKQISETNVESIQNSAQNVSSNVSSSISSAKESITNTMNDFSSKSAVNSGEEFLNSNSIVAKFVFIIFLLIVFFILLNLGVVLIVYFQKNENPYLINGLISGNANLTIPQNPKNPDSVVIYRSNNRDKGLEATWSVWLLFNDINDSKCRVNSCSKTTYSHIFNKGNSKFIEQGSEIDPKGEKIGVASINNAPGVYLTDNVKNTIRIYMDTINNNNVFVDITEIPLKKWFHLAIRIQNDIMDVYVNGTISARHVFDEVPKQNYEDVNIGKNGGFNGFLSNLVYYNRALGIFDINNIILAGPNTKTSGASIASTSANFNSYLSNMWYSSKI